MNIQLSGLASGFDWRSMVDQLVEVERVPQRQIRYEQAEIDLKKNAYGSMVTNLKLLLNRVKNLSDPAFFNARGASSSDEGIATVKAESNTPVGQYSFNLTQLATASRLTGSANSAKPLHLSNDVSGLVLGEAGFASDVEDGYFTVNGKQVDVAATDTLADLFSAINTATSGAVTAAYDSASDQIVLTSGSEIVLGSAADTSDFLTVAKLRNNGTGSVSSGGSLGAVNLSDLLVDAHFNTTLTDGGSGEGAFKINGVTISYDTAADSVADVLGRISDSSAGVSASYDPETDRFLLSNTATGDLGMALEDVTGNFLSATGLSLGTLSRGQNALYTVDGGAQLVSESNTLSGNSSGLNGLMVEFNKIGTVNIDVATDTGRIKDEIKTFIDDYNRVQSQIASDTASTTDANNSVSVGIFQGESDVGQVARRLRSLVTGPVAALPVRMDQLVDVGIVSNGNDDRVSLDDESALDLALNTDLSGLKGIFAGGEDGLANQLQTYIDQLVGEEGSLLVRQDTLSGQRGDMDAQIVEMERLVKANEQRLIDQFVAMELAQAKINQEMQFLSQRFGGGGVVASPSS
jgi:flagellar hook-associated protein 2